MFDPTSPILDFYPTEFEQDLNGKKQDWEAVVKIPFIDEERLLKAMDCAPVLFACSTCSSWKSFSTRGSPDGGRETAERIWNELEIYIQPRRADRVSIIASWFLPHPSPLPMRHGTVRSTHA